MINKLDRMLGTEDIVGIITGVWPMPWYKRWWFKAKVVIKRIKRWLTKGLGI